MCEIRISLCPSVELIYSMQEEESCKISQTGILLTLIKSQGHYTRSSWTGLCFQLKWNLNVFFVNSETRDHRNTCTLHVGLAFQTGLVPVNVIAALHMCKAHVLHTLHSVYALYTYCHILNSQILSKLNHDWLDVCS